ncbi:MAG: HAD family hydrolase [Turicibacter sp.]|nr:HAD family hydrolase [Turicibacter sp.]
MKKIVSDLDGTLLSSQKNITETSIQQINRCRDAGHQVMIATARPPRNTLDRLPVNWHDGIVVCYNPSFAPDFVKKHP